MAIVRKHRSKVLEVRQILPDVCRVRVESLDRPFQYRPGQFLHLALDPYDATQPWPESRCFSIQSPPAKSERTLEISFSTKGAFTKRMAQELVPGREVCLKMPYGDLLDTDFSSRPCVFIAGGTGVTPFLSLFLDESFGRYTQVCLYLGVRNPSYHVFAKELEQAQRANPAFAVEVVREDVQGHIPLDQVLAKHGKGAVYFISGPPVMIRSFRERLLAAGVPGEQVRTDDWE
jgi:ferredoxin-NADP reductase